MKILLAGLTRGRTQASLSFAVSMLRLQIKLVTLENAPNLKCDIVFFKDMNAALNALWANKDYDVLVTLDTDAGVPDTFLTRAMTAEQHDAILGISPVPGGLDWDRIASAPVPTEPLAQAGLRYNISPVANQGNNYYTCTRQKDAGHTALWMRRTVLETIVAASAPPKLADGTFLFCRQTIDPAGALVHPDQAFLDLWTGTPVVDLDSPCSVVGPMSFAGCVGQRTVVR